MATISRNKINGKGKLQHMIAEDLFADDLKQVFSAKTGKYLGVIATGQEINFEEQVEALEQPKEHTNPNQLNLF